MKYCRFLLQGQPVYGRIEDRDNASWITDVLPPPEEDLAAQLRRISGIPAAPFSEAAESASENFDPIPLSQASLLPPVTPSKIICVGRNYRDHAKELGNEVPAEPLLFFKPPSSLLAPGATVRMPAVSQRVDFEGELAFVVARRTSKLPSDGDWRSVIRGYTLANDVTARDLQK